MAKYNETYYTGKDQYSDGDIEDTILEIAKSGRSLYELEQDEATFPVVYHMSHIRQNIFIWYPFKEDASILEVGAGCGAISGILCQKAKQVTAVELSKKRASINYERNKLYDNLEIMVGNLNDMKFEQQFDYIILNGVFEYAASFTEGNTPYETFLSFLADKLNDGGRILVAIENRLGIKYFAGAPEDNLNQYFLGLNNYEGVDSVRTFSKNEFEQVCINIGMVCNKFYYPYPDYKFPYEIFTDESINSELYGRPYVQFDENRAYLINENKISKTLAKEGIAEYMANSFLVEVTKEYIKDDISISYVKLGTDRNEEFQIYTTIWNDKENKYVSKYPACQAAKNHVNNMLARESKDNAKSYLSGTKGLNDEAIYPFLKVDNLDIVFAQAVAAKEWSRCREIFDNVYNYYLADGVESNDYDTEDFKKVFGDRKPFENMHCKSGMDIDLIFDNIFCLNDSYTLIDTEWVFDFDIPTEYVMWRIINEAYYKHPALYDGIDRTALLHKYGISEFSELDFRDWEYHFANVYVGSGRLQKYGKAAKKVNIAQSIKDTNGYDCIDTTLYVDYGNGMIDENSIRVRADVVDERFFVLLKIDSEQSIQGLRWDPVEDYCTIRDIFIKSNKNLNITPINARYPYGRKMVFETGDPCFSITGEFEGLEYIEISGYITPLSIIDCIDQSMNTISYYENKINNLREIINKKKIFRRLLSKIKHTPRKMFMYIKKLLSFIKKCIRWSYKKSKGLAKKILRPFIKHKPVVDLDNIIVLLQQNIVLEIEEYSSDEIIDIIVPIYNGYDYLVRLFPTLLKTKMKNRILLVDDCSPDNKVHELEESFAAEHDNVIILNNPENYGFVKSVNNALQQTTNHVALINTDTELPDMWLERLMMPIITGDKIGSTTPFSNSATIFSFPNFCQNNEIYRGLSVDEIDSVFGMFKTRFAEAPTGVGFCMGMNKNAIQEIGTLDYETFSKGFGEENDWCQRAIRAGYKNVQVENLFVYHKHGGSFTSEEKAELLRKNVELVGKRYPNYNQDVYNFVLKDINKDLRELAQMLIDVNKADNKSILAFDHSLGGGATSYLDDKVKKHTESGDAFTVIRYDYLKGRYTLDFKCKSFYKQYCFNTIEELFVLGRYFHFDQIFINELVTYPCLFNCLEVIKNFARENDSDLIFLFHDYFAVCPTINLLENDDKYCEFPEAERCNTCFLKHEFNRHFACNTVEEWRKPWKEFLEACDEVRCFSEDTMNRVKGIYGNKVRLSLVPHKVEYLFPINKKYKTTDTINIGLLGIIAIHKGERIIREMLEILKAQNMTNVNIILIGDTETDTLTAYPNFRKTGRYTSEQLVKLVYENDIDMFFVPAVWPETFSYTTEEIMQMGLPIAAFDIGAPASRIKNYDKGLIISQIDSKVALEQILDYINEHLLEKNSSYVGKKMMYIIDNPTFSSRYRIEHLKEQLLTQGLDGDIYDNQHYPKSVDWSKVAGLVVYRCMALKPVEALINQAKNNGVKVWYDIDDLIFDYDKIKNFDFISKQGMEDYEAYSSGIRACMSICDGLITSTETLAVCMRESFPNKKVVVNRNRASSQMLILSNKARINKNTNRDYITMGYFSGSNTHNADFELIADVVFEALKNNHRLRLMIVGVLELNEKFIQVDNQIIKMDFVPWQKLPELIASIDINLMPLENTIFHASKSENKWMEAGLVEVATIGSYNQEMNISTINGENIVLCRNKEEWNNNLNELIDDESFRMMIAKNAKEKVLDDKSTIYGNEILLKLMED